MKLRVKQLMCDNLNGMKITQIILAAAICTLDRDMGPLEGTAVGSWSIGMVEQFQGEVCC